MKRRSTGSLQVKPRNNDSHLREHLRGGSTSPARTGSSTGTRRNGDSFVFCAQHLSYDGTWQKTSSGDWSMVRENTSLGQRLEAGTWLISREARRQFDVARPSLLARICARRPDPRRPGGVDALIAQATQRGEGGHRLEHVLAIPPRLDPTSQRGYATNVSLSH